MGAHMKKIVTARDRKTGPDYYTIVAWLDSIGACAREAGEPQ
eukprot:SAG25_NODE_13785_length_263_cov_0.628049_1_plen_41_part_01